ncbi:hypothetical protein GCM10011515_19970 [Tsuneonella deserti]|uniref:Protein TonB n=1 Tax=Tsuneonella deserti TaxID=2035528 RepID=A0ABQ1SB14_9SPHN|nr:energy transducer TonB [Tsuneonella deserti]GGE00185.1 hypothetical protein GCM10011515_19970 [Tsuneonella deserti]
MYGQDKDPRRRAGALALTIAVHGALAAGLLLGLRSGGVAPDSADTPLVTVDMRPPPPPPPPPPTQRQSDPAKGRPGDEGAKADAMPVEAPTAPVPLRPAPAASVAGEGRDVNSGAGTAGTGTGAGSGSGTGGSDGGGAGTPAQRIAGALRDSDYPRAAEAAGLAGTVAISFRVRTDGAVDRCTVLRSSGHALLDDLTCRLFTARFRFRPATNGRGEAVESTLQTSFTWGTRRR